MSVWGGGVVGAELGGNLLPHYVLLLVRRHHVHLAVRWPCPHKRVGSSVGHFLHTVHFALLLGVLHTLPGLLVGVILCMDPQSGHHGAKGLQGSGAELLDELKASLGPTTFLDGLTGEGELGGTIVAAGNDDLPFTASEGNLGAGGCVLLYP